MVEDDYNTEQEELKFEEIDDPIAENLKKLKYKDNMLLNQEDGAFQDQFPLSHSLFSQLTSVPNGLRHLKSDNGSLQIEEKTLEPINKEIFMGKNDGFIARAGSNYTNVDRTSPAQIQYRLRQTSSVLQSINSTILEEEEAQQDDCFYKSESSNEADYQMPETTPNFELYEGNRLF